MAVIWADISEWQVPVDDTYPHPVLAIRSNDGGYRDKKWNENYSWARRTLDAGRLNLLIVYLVYRPDWKQTAQTHIDMIGAPHPRMVTMIDVESWGGEITGDHSDGINRLYWRLADWLGNPRRVIGYGNRSDLDSLWPIKPPGVRLVVASYGSIPRYPGMIAHQYADNEVIAPFGACDANSANDYDDPDDLAAALGISSTNFFTITDIGDEEHDTVHNIKINDTGRVLLICPTGDAAANKRQAWLSAALLDLAGTAWIQVYAQGMTGGTDAWRWTEADLAMGSDNLVRRVWKEIPNNTSHLIISWDVSGAPGGGALCLETKTNA